MSKIKPTLNLNQFMRRQKVLSLYRNILRAIRKVPGDDSQNELKEWARRDFKNNMHHNDDMTIKMCILQGERALKELQTTISLAK